MYDPQTEKVIKMVQTISDKHKGQMHWLQLHWKVLDLYDASYDGLIQQPVPYLDIAFK